MISWEEIIDGSNNKYKLTTDLQNVSGVKYRFYVSNEEDNTDEIKKEIIGNNDNTFTFDEKWNNVFCYGKEVDDFHILDKQKLCALNVSATQEIDKQQQADKAKITSLEAEVASLKTTLASVLTRLNTLEDPLTEVRVLESKPPVHDSATEIVRSFLINLL